MTEQLRDEVARDVERIVFRRCLEKRVEGYTLEASKEITDAAIAIVVERAAKMIETMQCYGESDVDAGYDSALREAADAVRALQEQNKESR